MMDEDKPTMPPNLHLVSCCGSCIYRDGYLEDTECSKHKYSICESWICDDYAMNDAEWLQPAYYNIPGDIDTTPLLKGLDNDDVEPGTAVAF